MTVASAKVRSIKSARRWFVELSMHPRDQAEHLLDAAELWAMWGDEKEAGGYDLKGYMNEYLEHIRAGTCLIIVIYDGEPTRERRVPAAMVTLHRQYDSAAARIRVVGERLFVAPPYRKSSAFFTLYKGVELAAYLLDAKEIVVSAPVGAKQIGVYERAGFRASDVIMKREVT